MGMSERSAFSPSFKAHMLHIQTFIAGESPRRGHDGEPEMMQDLYESHEQTDEFYFHILHCNVPVKCLTL